MFFLNTVEMLYRKRQIAAISRQLEIAKFLGNAEKEDRSVGPYLKYLLDIDTDNAHSQ